MEDQEQNIKNLKPSKKENLKDNEVKLSNSGSTWKKEENFFDDGTMTFFWRAHTLTTLFVLVGFLIYEAIFSKISEDAVDNSKRGFIAVLSGFILLGVTMTPDGPFKRPHPAVWRFSYVCSIVYELILIFALYQSAMGTRKLLKYLDEDLGEPLKEKDYGGNCRLYDPDVPDNPFHNILDKMDLFVPLHLFGWWLKALLLRDWWLCWVISIMFEALEYTLEHQLPNFSECWWDHLIMDTLLCNGLGIYLGLKTMKYFAMKKYHWRGLWNIPTYRGKFRRIIGQFGPYVWVSYDWKPLSSIGRWCSTIIIIALFLLTELNTFYLKFVLWIPPGHWVNLLRLLFILPWGAVAIREVFQYLDDPDCVKFGRQSWMFLAIISTEFLMILKFGWETIIIPFPRHVTYIWMGILIIAIIWTVWIFIFDTFKVDQQDVERRRDLWTYVKMIETKISYSEQNKISQFFRERFLNKSDEKKSN